MRIVPVAQLERIHPQPVRERVDGLLEPEGALRVPWRAERRRRSGMQEYVGLLDVHHLGGVDVLHRPRAAGPRGAARAAKRVEAQRGELSLLGRADAQPLDGAGTVPHREVLAAAIEEQAHRRARLAREVGGDDAVVAGAELRPEPAAGELADDAHLALRQIEERRQLLLHAMDALGALVDGEPVGLPVRDGPVSLDRGVGLHLGREALVDGHRARRQRLVDVPFLGNGLDVGAAHVAPLRQPLGRSAASRGRGLLDRSLEDERRVGTLRRLDVGGVRQHFVVDLHAAHGVFRERARRSGDCRDRLPLVAHDRVLAGRLGLDAQLGGTEDALHHVRRLDPRHLLRCAQVHVADARMRMGRAHHGRVEHAREPHVVAVAGAPGDFLGTLDARRGPSDHG